MKSQDRKRN